MHPQIIPRHIYACVYLFDVYEAIDRSYDKLYLDRLLLLD